MFLKDVLETDFLKVAQQIFSELCCHGFVVYLGQPFGQTLAEILRALRNPTSPSGAPCFEGLRVRILIETVSLGGQETPLHLDKLPCPAPLRWAFGGQGTGTDAAKSDLNCE